MPGRQVAATLLGMKNRPWKFTRHYLEMVAVMFAGMIVLGIPAEGLLRLLGTSTDALKDTAPEVVFLGMALTMTVPMVWLMRRMGHAWRPCWEMAASMFVPTFGAIAAMWTGVSDDFGTLMVVEHPVMLVSMLAAMLLRYSEYAGGHEHHGPVAA